LLFAASKSEQVKQKYIPMKKSIIILFLGSVQTFCQTKDTLYFDSNWQPTKKENHAFYRPFPLKKIGELVFIQDFYKNGNMQMQGYVLASSQEEYVGDVYWYNENGTDKRFSQFTNTQNESLIYYHPNGKVWKKIQYQNGVKDGKTIIYKNDGTVLISGIYKNGKPFEGEFYSNLDKIDYQNSNNQIEANMEEILFVETIQETQIDSAASYIEPMEIELEESINNDIKKLVIKTKQFYANNYTLAQEITYRFEEDNFLSNEIIAIKSFDRTGKLIQNITKKDIDFLGHKIKNGIQYTFFTQNDFIVGIASQTQIKDGYENGKSIAYYPNGSKKIDKNYIKGNLEGETIEYHENGTVKTKRVYKGNNPFNGDFVTEFNPEVFIYETYINGKIEGTVIARTKKDSIITKGVYKNGKPFKGTFFGSTQEFDHNEINTIENFTQNGKQLFFSYDYKKPTLSTMIVNGKKEGETIFYNDDGTIKSSMIFKDDKMFDGVFSAEEDEITMRNGKLVKVETRKRYCLEDAKEIADFEDGKRKKVQYYKVFLISEAPHETYTGIYMNEAPFDGYFYESKDEFKTVDYFENGIKKFQYSNDYLKNMDNYQYPIYNLKTVYKNNRIVDGIEYLKGSKSLVLKYWNNEILQAIDLDLFAINYFNRIHFELKDSLIEITDHGSKTKIIIEEKDKTIIKKYVSNSKVLHTNSLKFDNINQPLTSNSNIVYFIINNEIKSQDYTFIKNKNDSNDLYKDNEFRQTILSKIYPNIDFDVKTVPEYFNEISKMLSAKDIEVLLFKKDFDECVKYDDLTFLETDENGNPINGIHITNNNNNLYNLKRYSNLAIILSRENISIIEIKKIISEMYLEKE
jgi:uncharacterized protein